MSTNESIVVSLDWAKKLEAAGWPGERTGFFFCQWSETDIGLHYVEKDDDFVAMTGGAWERYHAPTAEEILRRLPRTFQYEGEDVFLCCEPMQVGGWWTVGYINIAVSPKIRGPREKSPSLANAASAMYCHLAEQKLLPSA